MKFDIENAGMGTDEHAIHIAELFDNEEIAKAKAEEIDFALRLTEEMRKQIKEDNDFMYEEDPKTLMGTYSTMVRRGILETMWNRARIGGHITIKDGTK